MTDDSYTPQLFDDLPQPFNGTLTVESGRPTTLLGRSDSGWIVDVRNHGPDPIWVRSIDDGPPRMSLKMEPGHTTRGYHHADGELVATTAEPTWIRPAGAIINEPNRFARVSVRRFRTGERQRDGRRIER